MNSPAKSNRCDECGGHGYLEVSPGGERETCEECGVTREKHGTYPTCATHEFRACCSATPSEPYRMDCWDAGQCLGAQLICVHSVEWENTTDLWRGWLARSASGVKGTLKESGNAP